MLGGGVGLASLSRTAHVNVPHVDCLGDIDLMCS